MPTLHSERKLPSQMEEGRVKVREKHIVTPDCLRSCCMLAIQIKPVYIYNRKLLSLSSLDSSDIKFKERQDLNEKVL